VYVGRRAVLPAPLGGRAVWFDGHHVAAGLGRQCAIDAEIRANIEHAIARPEVADEYDGP